MNAPSKHRAKGYCGKHYARWRKHGNPLTVLINKQPPGQCSVDGCMPKHYSHNRNHGTPVAKHKAWGVHRSRLYQPGTPKCQVP